MKNKFLLTIALAAGLFTSSCNMDLAPIGSIDDQVALQTINDASNFRNGFYSGLRDITSSQFITYADIQADMFNGLTVNGNRMGVIANGTILSNNSDIYSYWSSLFYYVNNCNYFFEYAEPMLEQYKEGNDEFDYDRLNLFISEGHFFRGYLYAIMFDRWCVAYSNDIANTPGMGLPIVTKFAPTPDRKAYPSRSSMKETLDFIQADLKAAYDGIKAWEDKYPEIACTSVEDGGEGRLVSNGIYISSLCVQALQARIALWTGDYGTAQTLAQGVIDSGVYTMSTTANFPSMWTNDANSEIIYSPYETTQELGNAIGAAWLNNTNGADYIPSATMVQDYIDSGVEKDNLTGKVKGYLDVRYAAYLSERNIKSAFGNIKSVCFNKFPGNNSLQTGSGNNYVNKPKPFRLTEMYFIVMESAFAQGNETKALEMYNYYMGRRVKKYKSVELAGPVLRDEIRKQKGLEFVGEGFRLSDLRRWKMGFNRADNADYSALGYSSVSSILTPIGLEVDYTTTDHRYTWPIPSDEITVNPQMAGQQNPGY